jgi:hypothetical protein
MNNDISEETKTALARVRYQKARERLHRDGADSRPAMQRRIQALAAERSIPPVDYAKLLHKRPSAQAVIDFCKKHKVSANWLLCGDLRGLRQMTQEARAESPVEQSDAYRDLLTAFGKLDSAGRRAIVSYLKTQI